MSRFFGKFSDWFGIKKGKKSPKNGPKQLFLIVLQSFWEFLSTDFFSKFLGVPKIRILQRLSFYDILL